MSWPETSSLSLPGLFPAILNLASNAEITTNATCGEPEPEMYCKLVEHVPGRRIRNSQCRTCNAQSQNLKEQHPITNAIDGTNGWWQSPSIKNGRQFHLVTITLDLRQIFQVAYIIIKAANSPRPGNWVLERSMDGVEYTPWQYYAISDTECLTRYNITPRFGPPTYKRDDEVICTSYYSRLVPLEHGEIHTSLINGRPSADQLTPELLDFTSARYIRLRLQRIRTLNADLMTLSYRDPKEVDPIVTRRYYYSIKDISVGGMCICYGHAQSCPWDPTHTVKLQCVCEHNTCGESCNECCPGYHQEPWQPGTLSNGNTCEKCNCHNKSEDCYYNQTMDDHKMSMNSHGHFHGGGVCINCTQNTAGVNCETCADGFYRPHEVLSPHCPNPCVECGCDMRGSLTPACLNPGQCLCKEGFVGERCERCAFGYRDFPLCSRCECSLEGSLNIDPCTECICKENVMGANCDLCKQGFYNLEDRNPEGCTECFCFGVSDVCESSPWSLFQSNTFSIFTIFPFLFFSHCFVKLTSYGGLLNYTVAYDVSVDNVDNSLPSQFDLIIEGNGRTLRQSPPQQLFLTPLREQLVSVELLPQGFVDLHTGQRVDRDELMTVLADLAGLRIRGHLNASAEGALRLSTVSLDTADIRSANRVQARDVEQCECPWGYLGTSCEYCSSGFYRVGGILFGGNCLQCECNDHATECDINGVCLDCTHNTTGPHCNQCLPGYYGDTSEGTPEDCQRCACPLIVATNNFSPTCLLEGPVQVTCDQCQQGYTGTKCERCANGYHGDPTVAGKECVLCECNGNVDPWDPGHCDTSSGVCLKCHSHTSGDDCERCEDGYYGDAITAKNCQACGCHGNGSYSAMCDLLTGQCTCKPNVVGEKCDQCQVGFHSLLSGQGCRDCNCSQSGSVSTACEEEGRCQCIPGVAGDKCDRCYHGYFNYQDSGCTQCECAHTHGNCNATTGKCICPPHTIGEKCELCEEGHWGHDTVAGCKSCDCSEAGSSATQCDLTNGQCLCRPDFASEKCDQCTMGYRGYPECTACNCNINGTREEFCDKELGLCSCEAPGNCVCKDNVGGGGCDECKKGSFGLSGPNPAGCSPCFCFGVSSDCEELGGMVRVPITLGSDPELLHVVSQSDPQGSVEGVYYQASDMLLDTRETENITLPGPYYWRLPKHYQGNKLLSYGGKLSYMVAFYALDGAGLANYEPQVLMRGGHLGKKVIYIDMPAPDNRVKTRQDIPLTEHKWKYFNSVSEKAVSHSDFLAVLSNIEYITIKASYGTGLQQSRISNITMDTALEAEEGSEGLEVACLIETCECPAGYAGLSCQECAPGYYRQPVTDLNLRGRRPLIQPCVPCQCNNHSQACDLDTGECLGCQHNTAGEHCNVCGSGYYGNVKGSVGDCSLCACPLKENSFSPTCAMEGVMGDFRCNACKPGYEGRYSCDDECTGVLLYDLDALERSFLSVNLTGVILSPYSTLVSLKNDTQEVKVKEGSYYTSLSRRSPVLSSEVLNDLNLSYLLSFSARTAESKLKEAESRTERLYDRLKPLKTLGENLSRNLSEIREMINQARKQAASIKVAVLADKNCVRAYKPEVSSSNFNTLTMTVKTSEPDNLLFYMGSSSSVDFMAVEMQHGKVAYLWDAGSGHTKLEYPDVQINNNKWHRINATRFGRHGTLSVHQLESEPLPAVKTTSPGSATILEVNKSTLIFVGGLGGQIKSSVVKMTQFKGCMGEASLNEKNIGLWNYAEREGQCRGCFMSPQTEETSFHFDGSGYSVVEKPLRSTSTSIVMLFKTLSPNGLLLYLASNGTVRPLDFLSIELVEGQVRLTFELGSGPLTLTSNKAYNTGSWYKITLQRNKRKGGSKPIRSVSVLREGYVELPSVSLDPQGELLASFSTRNDTGIILAGFSKAGTRKSRQAHIIRAHTSSLPFLAVMLISGRLEVHVNMAEGGSIHKVVVKSRSGSFSDGQEHSLKYFISLLASLPDSFSLELSVRTYAQSGLIYYMAHANQMDYATLQLLGGHLFFTCDKGSGPATATFPVPVNDGQWHTVKTDFNKKSVVISVDGQPSTPVPAKGNTLDVENKLYLGGLPQTYNAKKIGNVTHSLAGCIQKVMLNSVKLDTQSPVSEQSTAHCFAAAQDGTFFNGSGYAALIKNGYKVGSDMEVALEFRSTVPDGVLLGVSSAKVDAIGLELANGQAVFHVNNGAGRVSATSRLGWWLCDGRWHTLLAKKTKNALSLTVDGVTVLTDNPHPQSTSAETKDPVYVGGFPVGVKQNCLTSRMPFRGCMRNIRLIKGHMTNILDFSTAFTLQGVSPHSCPSTAT
uniref:Laminin, alpha 1 n=1 Tax=Salmo trutta TaxID=8032 RepID=A0A674CGI3_SALTR